ncbi:MAG: AbrB/MazE/SpoVT family DNA-binding domain-containing protein [Methylococcaceae bacterium]|nr:AbrB/MazE/SpoVT family DNA-binding domain-containing protein [Methylococcaceae bacterium]
MTSSIAQVSTDGRIVIPVEIRRKMGIHAGDQLILSYHESELHIATRKQRLQQAQVLVKAYVDNTVSLADELIRERRAEANE